MTFAWQHSRAMTIDMWRVRFSSAAGDIGDNRDERERERELRVRGVNGFQKRRNEDNVGNGSYVSFVKSKYPLRLWTRAKRA